jgi:polar amino acid transport system substrate-binding protein
MKNFMRRSLMKGALALALAGGVALPAAAQSLTERGKGDGLRVAYYNFAPFAYVDGSGNVIGEQVEILRHVLGQMGLKVAKETSTEWGNLIPGLKAKRFDIVAAAMFVTPKRCKEVAFSEPTFGIKQALIVEKGNPNGLTAYESVRDAGVNLAAISGTAQVDWAKSVGVEASKIMQVPDTATGLAAVGAKRAKAFAIDAPGARLAVKEQADKFEMLEPFGEVGNKPASPHGAYATRPDEKAFVEEFNKHLAKFIGTPEHIAIMQKHGLEPTELPIRTTADLCQG